MRIVYMGTPDFAVPSLDQMVAAGHRPIAVVTGPDKRRGRGRRMSPTAVKRAAMRHEIPILQPDSVKDPAFAEEVVSLEADLIVVVAFKILPLAVFGAARIGAFNLHGSLLPAFRGAAPIQHALMAGVTETGVTTFFLREKVDTGNIILQKKLPVGPEETAGELHDRMMILGAEAVVESIERIASGKVEAKSQDELLASPAPKITSDDCKINWAASSRQVHNQIRAVSPFPGAWTDHDEVRLKIYRTSQDDGGTNPSPGTVVTADSGRLRIACGTGSIDLLELKRAGRSKMPVDVFLNGYAISTGDQLT